MQIVKQTRDSHAVKGSSGIKKAPVYFTECQQNNNEEIGQSFINNIRDKLTNYRKMCQKMFMFRY